MLGIYLLFVLAGRPFYRLALDYDKNEWLYGFLGILSFFIGSNVAAFFLVLFLTLFGIIDFTQYDENVLGLIGVPFGILTCWLYYKNLNKRWERGTVVNSNADVLDDDFLK